MTAVVTDLPIEQGTSWSWGWQVFIADPAHPTDPPLAIDDTWVARAQARSKVLDPTVLHQFDVEVSGGIVKMSVLPETSSAWTWTSAVYDVEVESVVGIVYRVAEGRISVSREVTR